ncbi:succinate dehydrogenase, hydrophobic membrane anchor protein [Sphingomonas hylomeconis]|uniref:Succinate dehydrogenase hydrophobic membrane anchor subunit n=1 Tax=Sphingomonas hylomeconis TaxID=1395958 RepID=A0ABV7SUH4_9SPHN|nr:succinate dehydrogenase, hydrophobic membrane anchor protein [Sphingomonas hylomeconis]
MGNGTNLGRVRGLGSANEGAHHWWQQRVTAAANLFLMLWFLLAIAQAPGYDFDSIRLWLSSAWVAIPLLLLIASVFYHFRLGLQVVIEDYQHGENRVALMLLLNFFTVAAAGVAIFSILKIAFTGVPK